MNVDFFSIDINTTEDQKVLIENCQFINCSSLAKVIFYGYVALDNVKFENLKTHTVSFLPYLNISNVVFSSTNKQTTNCFESIIFEESKYNKFSEYKSIDNTSLVLDISNLKADISIASLDINKVKISKNRHYIISIEKLNNVDLKELNLNVFHAWDRWKEFTFLNGVIGSYITDRAIKSDIEKLKSVGVIS